MSLIINSVYQSMNLISCFIFFSYMNYIIFLLHYIYTTWNWSEIVFKYWTFFVSCVSFRTVQQLFTRRWCRSICNPEATQLFIDRQAVREIEDI